MRRLFERLRNRTAAFVHDLVMVPIAWISAYWLRFNLESIPEQMLNQAMAVLPAVVIIQGGVFWYMGLYRGVWRFASLPDLLRILKAVVVGISVSAIVIFFFTRMQDIPRSVFPLQAILLVVLLGGPRLAYRWLKDHRLSAESSTRVLIVGAGRVGEMLVRDLLRQQDRQFLPVGFVDDDREKRGREIHGLRVLAKCGRIPRLVREKSVDLVLLAVPTATGRQMRRLVSLCERSGVPFRTVPRMTDLASGRSTLKALRDVSIEDLLGRDTISLDWLSIEEGIEGKAILVTGGGGSIGAELCRQLARAGPGRIIVADDSEYNLYVISMELQRRFPDLVLDSRLLDVRDRVAVDRAMQSFRPDIVFHAAAFKHVPMLESQVREAVRNNVLGTENVALAAVEHDVGKLVLISTDKAVNPTNVMGASKRVAEMICQGLSGLGRSTRFVTVRFGNVLDSAGSVVPLFRQQISEGGPVTVTHRDVKRYFMTIPEASQLIMEAATVGRGGEIFVLDMGEPIRIGYLAEQMILLAGKAVGDDIEIVYTGLRPGEKLFEELFHDDEQLTATRHDKLLLARDRKVDWSALMGALERLRLACEGGDEEPVRAELTRLVPEFSAGRTDDGSKIVRLDEVKR